MTTYLLNEDDPVEVAIKVASELKKEREDWNKYRVESAMLFASDNAPPCMNFHKCKEYNPVPCTFYNGSNCNFGPHPETDDDGLEL